ncbi:MAG: sulfite exporter TauE/SafE family protein [candidate division Zixibacteria bacterium]|nr:sulfite exporter TauE/SafE family protein [candidate division Zixibacteria bacterium]
MIEFPISGVETYWWLPTLVAFCISAITSTGGVTGAFILLPFSVSVLGYTSPGVSPTNLLYNVIAIPAGVWRFHKEKRMLWSLAWATVLATVPGQTIGAVIRLKYLPDVHSFKLFAGLVLLYLGGRLLQDVVTRRPAAQSANNSAGHRQITMQKLTPRFLTYEYDGMSYSATTWPIILISFVVGIVGGIYGIGGGALLSPYFVAIYQLPVHSIAGAMLLGTFLSALTGIIVYIGVSPFFTPGGSVVMPDWYLGLAFGIGGAIGVYVGARMQRHVPARVIKIVLVVALLWIAVQYIGGYFWR